MKDKWKGFISGAISMALLSATIFAVTAEPVEKVITVIYDNIKVFAEGKLIQLKDVNGNPVEPFVSNGTTYLPVRAISEALGKTVDWDENTNSVYIGEKPSKEINEVIVETPEQFLKAISSNTKILVKAASMNLSTLKEAYRNGNVVWEKKYGEFELQIKDVENLTIEGLEDTRSELLIEPRSSTVISFTNAKNVSINNIRAGHTPDRGICTGAVFNFNSSNGINFNNCELFGCGSYGIILGKVNNFTFNKSIITECTYGAMAVYDSKNLVFKESQITDTTGLHLVNIDRCKDVKFESCEIFNNDNSISNTESYAVFFVRSSENIMISGSNIYDNKSFWLVKQDRDTVKFDNTGFVNNTFVRGVKSQIYKGQE